MLWEHSNQVSCPGKKAFLTWKQAATHNNRMLRPGSALKAKGKKVEKLHVYKCVKCKLLHIGHEPRRLHPRLSQKPQQVSPQTEVFRMSGRQSSAPARQP